MVVIHQKKPSCFEPICEVSTVFMEYQGRILFLCRARNESSPDTWGIPGGKLEIGETPLLALVREIKEELSIEADQTKLSLKKTVFVDHPKIKYVLHLFTWMLEHLPSINLEASEHSDYVWILQEDIGSLQLIEGQLEAFYLVYEAEKNFK
jgi:8-oxo-dGTP diphosphatase